MQVPLPVPKTQLPHIVSLMTNRLPKMVGRVSSISPPSPVTARTHRERRVALQAILVLPNGDVVGSLMSEVVDGTSKMTEADQRAIIAYLRSLPPIDNQIGNAADAS